ncbi:septal ring lytic transglycosylase RlpA family protein [Brachybacterium sp. EF45031]|uniref:septal ring lytic transglycosylase RlpA family protein n=1 Tax=Brachybacterium sillae TaxID=2810536 RepID=UPI002559C28F|nr:septal ring lytic transglycosylase RlpA family protein [Brachybacterium sillae]MCS6711253.1 septal ring lytic transglycosylase RlpA family protein [Brachybacterium sillae]
MSKKPVILGAAATACALALGGGGAAYAVSDQVDLTVYGEHSSVRTFGGTVEQVLASQGVTPRATDLVTPALDTPVDDDTTIQVVQQRPVTVTIDGKATEVLTPGTTVADALRGFEAPLAGATITPAPTTKLQAEGNQVTVVTRKTVTFKGQYGQDTFEVNAVTVDEAMKKVLQDIQPSDTANPGRDTLLKDGMVVTVQRVREGDRTVTEKIPFRTVEKKTDELFQGERKVQSEGVEGERTVVLHEKKVDGKAGAPERSSEKVTKQPQDRVILVGTKERPAPKPRTSGESQASSRSEERREAASSKPSKAPVEESTRSSEKSSAPRKTSSPAPRKTSTPSPTRSSESSRSTDQGGTPQGSVNTCGASFYDEGQMTASGERFNPNAMTAAHKTLPLGTRVRVTNPDTGASVTVRINDRGPYISGRCLDLSRAAFDAIGDLNQGHMTVQWQIVG